MIIYCPNCQTAHLVANSTSDYVCSCNSGDVNLDYENKRVVGNYPDEKGNIVQVNGVTQPSANLLFGDRADNEGQRDVQRNAFGKSVDTNRLKKHSEYFKIKKINNI